MTVQSVAEQKVLQLNLTPDQIRAALPMEPAGIENGFSDKTLTASGVDFNISYDGESELLGICIRRAYGVSDEYCEQALRDFFETD